LGWRELSSPTRRSEDLGAKEAVYDLVHEDPDRALSVILKVVERIEPLPTTTLFHVLAAGPLEDLLAHHGPAIIDRVEAHARRDERFNLLLAECGGTGSRPTYGRGWRRFAVKSGDVAR